MAQDNGGPAPYRHGPAKRVQVDLPAGLARALDAWIAAQPEPRPELPDAIAFGLRDWLIGMGLLAHREYPENTH